MVRWHAFCMICSVFMTQERQSSVHVLCTGVLHHINWDTRKMCPLHWSFIQTYMQSHLAMRMWLSEYTAPDKPAWLLKIVPLPGQQKHFNCYTCQFVKPGRHQRTSSTQHELKVCEITQRSSRAAWQNRHQKRGIDPFLKNVYKGELFSYGLPELKSFGSLCWGTHPRFNQTANWGRVTNMDMVRRFCDQAENNWSVFEAKCIHQPEYWAICGKWRRQTRCKFHVEIIKMFMDDAFATARLKLESYRHFSCSGECIKWHISLQLFSENQEDGIQIPR